MISQNGTTFYAHGIFNKRESEAGAIFRFPVGDRNNPVLYPDGFLPHIAPKILDYSLSLGIKDRLQNGIKWDLSYTNGYNNFHFYVHNTHNDSLGDSSPTSFDSGGSSYRQQVINLDFSKSFELLTLAGGIEYRKEHYTIYKGEPDSYRLGEFSNNAGAQGFPGFLPCNEVDAHRENVGLYVDAKFNPSPNLTLEAASRFEHYSDFGNTFDGKFSALYRPTPSLMFRGSFNTGFRAPSLSQSYFTSTTAEYVVNGLDRIGSFAVNNPVARDLGVADLKPEISQHYTFGFVYQPSSNLSLSADYFYNTIDDRILLTGNISGSISPQLQAILNSYNVTRARYFTNAIDTQTDGVDVRLNYHHKLDNNLLLKTNLAYHYNSTQITHINAAPSIFGEAGGGILLDTPTRERIISGQPKHTFALYTQLTQGDWALGFNLKRFGEYASVLGEDLYRFDAKWVSDVEFSYQINERFKLSVGAKNLFDVYPDRWGDTGSDFYSTQGSFPYPLESPFGYNGRSYHVRIEGRF
jgi:iron complex outermembrane receptor protein